MEMGGGLNENGLSVHAHFCDLFGDGIFLGKGGCREDGIMLFSMSFWASSFLVLFVTIIYMSKDTVGEDASQKSSFWHCRGPQVQGFMCWF